MLGMGSVSSRSISGESRDLHLSAGGLSFVVSLERPRANQAHDLSLVGEDADDIGVPLHFLVKTPYNRWKRWSDRDIFARTMGPGDGGFGRQSQRRKDGRDRRDLSEGASHSDRFGR